MSGEIIDILATILAVFVLHYMVVLLLVRSSEKQEPWLRALESRNEARRQWKHAKASLKQATRNLKKTKGRTRRQPKGTVAVVEREAEETILKLQRQMQFAREKATSSYKQDQDARKLLDAAGRHVYETVCNGVTCKLDFYRAATRNLWKAILKFAKSTCCALRSVTTRIMKHHPLIAGVILTLVALAYDYFYYSRFNFNILPFYSDPAGGTLIAVVLVVLAVTVALLIFLSALIFFIVVIPLSAFLLLVISLIWAVLFFLGRPSAWTVGIYRRSVRLSQLTLLLASTRSSFLKVFQEFLNAIDQKVHRLIEKITDKALRKWVRNATVWVVWLLFVVLTIPALVYVGFIEPQYRAHHAYRGDKRVRVVVNQPSDGVADPMIKIGSNGSYLFAVPVEAWHTGAAGDRAKTTASEQIRNDGKVEMQSNWIEVWVNSFRDRIRCFWRSLLSDNGAAFNISEDEGLLRKFRYDLWLSIQGRLKFISNFPPPDFEGAVIALPPPRVHCVYQEDSDRAATLCAPSASDNEERLLRQQLASKIGCEQRLIVSKPFVFMPGAWQAPKKR